MARWNPAKVQAVRAAFNDFLGYLRIDSKETGGRVLLKPYQAQLRFLDGIFAGLARDVHSFTVLKARQLGVTTISLALDLFWLGIIDGLQGALIFDTEGNKEKSRTLLRRYVESLPPRLSFPRIAKENRNGLVLENGSTFDYLVAGVRKSVGSGGLGRSRAYNFCHATECSSWGDESGLQSLVRSLADSFPDRLYIWESTARGFSNPFYDMWDDAKTDELTKSAIFIGWWAKEVYAVARDSLIYEKYSKLPVTEREQRRIDAVKDQYGVSISAEQLAWYRHQADPGATGDELDGRVGSDILDQELPWTEQEAFLHSGANFFSGEAITHAYKGYRYAMSEEFFATEVVQVRTPRDAQLKVWEEPDPTGIYVVSADPAFGSSETADRYCCQVLKCYADGIDHVAEFTATQIATYQFAWIIAHLCGAYNNCRHILEINGPGEAVANEFRTLKTLMTTGYVREEAEETGLRAIFDHVRSYLYHRPDSLGGGYYLHFKTNLMNKKSNMNRLRDAFQMKLLKVRSIECLSEMGDIVESGDTIKGEGHKKDDRVMAMALGVRCWNDMERMRLVAQNYTREEATKAKNATEADMQAKFNSMIVGDFFARQRAGRERAARAARRTRWNW